MTQLTDEAQIRCPRRHGLDRARGRRGGAAARDAGAAGEQGPVPRGGAVVGSRAAAAAAAPRPSRARQ